MIVDTSEVMAFAAKLQAAPERKRRRVSMIVKKAAQNVKTDTRADLPSGVQQGVVAIGMAVGAAAGLHKDHGIWSHHFMANRWRNIGNSGRL